MPFLIIHVFDKFSSYINNYFQLDFSEFFQTERSHVRNLKVLDRLFYRPLLDTCHMSKELIERLFPNLEEVLAVHTKYNQRMKDRIKAGFPIGNVGDILSDMVRTFYSSLLTYFPMQLKLLIQNTHSNSIQK